MQASIYDVVEAYIRLYLNLQIRIIDMCNSKVMTPSSAIDVLVSFSIAQEGTNTLYISLIEVILGHIQKHPEEPFTAAQADMLLNYFPHDIWEQDSVENIGKAFYAPLLDTANKACTIVPK